MGNRTEYIELLQGDRPKNNNPFDGINTTWTRVENGKQIGTLVAQALAEFDFKDPTKSLSLLLQIHQAIEALEDGVWKTRKLTETKALIKSCAGLALQLNTERAYGVAGENIKLKLNAVQQSNQPIEIISVDKQLVNVSLTKNKAYSGPLRFKLKNELSAPYWLLNKGSLGIYDIENKALIGLPETPALVGSIVALIGGTEIEFKEPINFRENDAVRGEVITPILCVTSTGTQFRQNGSSISQQ